jgi:hypothetical protein
VESSCELGKELSGFIKCWKNIEFAAELVASRVLLNYAELVSKLVRSLVVDGMEALCSVIVQ